jgi:DnaJ-class molecular chaperone
MIQRISNGIGINHYEFLSMKAMYTQRYSQGGQQRSYQSGGQPARKKQGPSLSTCYQILGITSSSTEVELKKAYRKLAVKYHPDKVAHLGKDHVQTAEDKFQKVQEAYGKIKDSRGLN